MTTNYFEEFKLLEEQIAPKKEPTDDFTTCCDNPTVIIDTFRTCQVCGKCIEEFIYIIQSDSLSLKSRAIYKRISYFKHLLFSFSCRKISNSKLYDKAVNHLKNEKFETVQELRILMKKNKYHKLYPFIFVLYRDIKGQILIDLTHKQIDLLCNYFKKLEIHCRKIKKFFSYNLIINRLLFHLKYPFYHHVDVPASNVKLISEFDKILFTLNINK